MENVVNLEDEFFKIRRKKLEKKFAKAALELTEHTGAAAMCLPIKGTTPQVFIAIGTAEQIRGLTLQATPVSTAVENAFNPGH